ncbi:hypothetical protein CI109_101066 [Kwoniella shandongensis]|uniref:DUF7702 domain-containing protein n=1 Tax=Kwoniella shandongensis TaxID=1734106 RepID=A0A5M6CAL7_9TREE|nr:uncharacterized protein CI109_001535 [Kwoniella shandongensis]KAA5530129.1 hypothetical protein CI109_001535 [Kwoniella shandongensis]
MSSSSSSDFSDAASLGSINFTGGFPTSRDLAPSIIFLIIYILLVPVLIFRLVRKADRSSVLIRPTIFISARLAMLIIRAIMAKNSYGEGLLIAELVLVSVGFLFLITAVTACFKLQIDSDLPKDERPQWVKRLAQALEVIVLGAIGTAVIGSALISNALKDPSKLNTVKDLRRASVILSVAAVVILFFATIGTYHKFHLDTRGFLWILTTSACLIVVAVYRLVQTFSTNPDAIVRSFAAFWVLSMTFELLAFIPFVAISIPTWFPGAKERMAKSDIERAVQSSPYSMEERK